MVKRPCCLCGLIALDFLAVLHYIVVFGKNFALSDCTNNENRRMMFLQAYSIKCP